MAKLALVEFTKSFMGKFDVQEQLNGINGFFQLLKLLLSQYSLESKQVMKQRTLFTNGILTLTPTELFSFNKNSFDFIDKLVAENESDYYNTKGSLRLRVLGALWDSESNKSFVESIRFKFGEILKANLEFINNADQISSNLNIGGDDSSSSEADAEENTKEIKDVLFSLLGHILDLLPIQDFITSVLPLLSRSNDEAIRHHLTLVTATKFELEPMGSAQTADKVIDTLFENISGENEASSIVQASLNTLSALISKFGDKLDSSLLTQSLKISTQSLLSERSEIIISSLNVLTNIVQTLGVKSIAFYPKIVPPALKIFQKFQDSDDSLRQQLQLSVILLFASMIKRLPS